MGAETTLLEPLQLIWAPLVLKADPAPIPRDNSVVNTHEWPAKMAGELAWSPADFASEDDFTLTLNDAEILEVKSALKHWKTLGLRGGDVDSKKFPLGTLGTKLQKAAVDLHLGRGFVAIRGLNSHECTTEENVIIFQGIASYIAATKGRQSEDGEMFMHIHSAKTDTTPQEERPVRYSKLASTFHTDTFCDVLALQTLNNAEIGGSNLIASSWTIYNKLKESHPHVLDALAQPNWGFDSHGTFIKRNIRPILHYHHGRIIINFAREPLLGVPGIDRPSTLDPMTDEQRDALMLLEEISKSCQIKLNTEPGDLLFINNHGILHSREAFEDTQTNPRHLVRMWLKNEDLAWKLPSSLQTGNSRIYGDNELGCSWNIERKTPKNGYKPSERITS